MVGAFDDDRASCGTVLAVKRDNDKFTAAVPFMLPLCYQSCRSLNRSLQLLPPGVERLEFFPGRIASLHHTLDLSFHFFPSIGSQTGLLLDPFEFRSER